MWGSVAKHRKRESGFTLIELLVVVIILGILAAIVTVAVGNARDKANIGACDASAQSLKRAIELFYVDNAGKYPGQTTTVPATITAASLEASTFTRYIDVLPGLVGGNTTATNSGKGYYLQATTVLVAGTTYNVVVKGYDAASSGTLLSGCTTES